MRDLPVPPALLAELARLHQGPGRRHHGWTRVTRLLALAEEVAHAIADRPAFILAVLFHTAVLDRARPDAAAASVALMRQALPGAPPARLDRAAALVLAWDRQGLPETGDPSLRGDAALLLDMDLDWLAAGQAEAAATEAAIRAEHAHLSDDAWAAGRAAALRLMLWRPRLYRTDRWALTHEKPARRNLQRLLDRLEA